MGVCTRDFKHAIVGSEAQPVLIACLVDMPQRLSPFYRVLPGRRDV